jgi:hypothetical protein
MLGRRPIFEGRRRHTRCLSLIWKFVRVDEAQ